MWSGDIEVEKYNIGFLRRNMSLVSQEPILFDRTVAENIMYGDNERSEFNPQEIVKAAIKANADEFIEKLPQVRV